MKRKFIFVTIFAFLLVPEIVLANVPVPLSFFTVPIIPVLVLVESVLFWYLMRKGLKFEVGFWKSVWIIFLANIITSFMGTVFLLVEGVPFWNYVMLTSAFFVTVLVESGIYKLFFRKTTLRYLNLLSLSVMVNIVSYIPIFIFFTLIMYQ